MPPKKKAARKTRKPARRPARKAGGSPGPFAVGLMALHDRGFFGDLLNDPRATMLQHPDLNLTSADIDTVVSLIAAARSRISVPDALAAWDHYAATGHWGTAAPVAPVPLWPKCWPPERIASRL